MAVYQLGASIDENGKITGGKAGNQSGKELRREVWNLYKRGCYIIRAKDPAVRKKIALAARRAVKNRNIGYDQIQRNTLWNKVKGKGYDPGLASEPVETDCSALVRVCCAHAGIVVDDFNTSTERKRLMATGQFDLLDADKYCKDPTGDYLLEGDIAVTRKKGHTVVIDNDGRREGISPPEKRPMLRKGSKGSYVKEVQSALRKWSKNALPRYGVDGDFGKETDEWVRFFQRAYDLEVDGIVGPKTWAQIDEVVGG